MYPILLHLGPAVVPSYGVLAALAIVAGLLLSLRTARQQGLDPNRIWTVGVLALFAGAVVAKGAAVAMHWTAFEEQPLQLMSLTALGGSGQGYIGLATGLAVVLIFAWRQKIPVRAVLDTLSAPLLVALSIESVGCLLAGSAFGVPTHAWWGIKYGSVYALVWWGTPMGIPLEPVQIWTAVADLLLAALVYWMGSWGLRTGRVAGTAMFGGAIVHFLLQFWRGDVEPLRWAAGVLTGAQVACLLLLAGAAWLWWEPVKWQPPLDVMQEPGSRAVPR
jgi:phosphatidylglycerol---prolipoprotein diacylglyceryl transferase